MQGLKLLFCFENLLTILHFLRRQVVLEGLALKVKLFLQLLDEEIFMEELHAELEDFHEAKDSSYLRYALKNCDWLSCKGLDRRINPYFKTQHHILCIFSVVK